MNDPRFGPFQEWARTHDHRLVGAHSYSGWYPTSLGQPASAATVHWWNLAFADEHGNAMTVGVPRCPGSLFPTTCEASGVNDYGTIRTFPTGRTFLDLPDDPLTITGARTLLERSIPQEYQGRPINQVRWGVTWDPDGTVRDLGPETLRVELIDQPLWAGPADPPSARYWLEVNVQSGALLRLGSYANELASPSVSPVTSKAPLLQEAAAPAGAGEAPLVAAYGRSSLVASTVLAAFLAVYFYPLLKVAGAQAWTALPGYAKLRSSELLNNKFREGLLQLIRDEPGVSPPELHARVGGGWSTIVYHLGVLEKNKLVSSLIDGRHKRFFPTEALDWAKRPQVAVLRNARTRAFYGWIQEEPGLHQSDLAHRGGVRLGSAQWHLGRLERCGLVGREKRGHRVHYYPLGAAPPDPKAAVEVA